MQPGTDSSEAFKHVPNDYRLNWFMLNREIDTEELRPFGIGGLTVCVPYQQYLKSPEGWEAFREIVRNCTAAQISLWIMDEWGYPSGMAGGLVVEQDPRLESLGVLMQKESAKAGEEVSLIPPAGANGVAAFYYPLKDGYPDICCGVSIPVNEEGIRVKLPRRYPDDLYEVYLFSKKVIFEGTHSEVLSKNWKYSGRYPNLLEREATSLFIELTHENYKKNLPAGASLPRIFYGDEPSLTTMYIPEGTRPGGHAYIAWSDDLPNKYLDSYGEDIVPLLPCLFEGTDEFSMQTRIRFYRLIADILNEDWTGQIARWCEENKTNMSYHYFAEESMPLQVAHYGDLMHVMEPMQIPSVDIRLCKPGTSRHKEISAVRMVASVARHSGDKQTRAELDPILGGYTEEKPSPAAYRDNANYSFAMGLNNMTTYGHWKDYPEGSRALCEVSLYIGRIEMMLRDAVYLNNIGIFYPIESFQADYIPSNEYIWSFFHRHLVHQKELFDLDEQLMQQHIPASYITARVLDRCLDTDSLATGMITIGTHRYDTLIMPPLRVLSLKTAKQLMCFEANGGCLIWCGSIPSVAAQRGETPALIDLLAHCKPIGSVQEAVRLAGKRNRSVLHVSTGDSERDKRLTAQMFRRGDRQIAFIASLSTESLQITVSISGQVNATLYHPVTGDITEISLPFSISLGPSESILIQTQSHES